MGWEGGVGRDRLKLSQGDDVGENVLLADLKAGSGRWGTESSRHRKDTRLRRQDRFFTKVNRMLFCQWFP